jgi:hypothetical protein
VTLTKEILRERYIKQNCVNCNNNVNCTTAFIEYPLDICTKYMDNLESLIIEMVEVVKRCSKLNDPDPTEEDFKIYVQINKLLEKIYNKPIDEIMED